MFSSTNSSQQTILYANDSFKKFLLNYNPMKIIGDSNEIYIQVNLKPIYIAGDDNKLTIELNYAPITVGHLFSNNNIQIHSQNSDINHSVNLHTNKLLISKDDSWLPSVGFSGLNHFTNPDPSPSNDPAVQRKAIGVAQQNFWESLEFAQRMKLLELLRLSSAINQDPFLDFVPMTKEEEIAYLKERCNTMSAGTRPEMKDQHVQTDFPEVAPRYPFFENLLYLARAPAERPPLLERIPLMRPPEIPRAPFISYLDYLLPFAHTSPFYSTSPQLLENPNRFSGNSEDASRPSGGGGNSNLNPQSGLPHLPSSPNASSEDDSASSITNPESLLDTLQKEVADEIEKNFLYLLLRSVELIFSDIPSGASEVRQSFMQMFDSELDTSYLGMMDHLTDTLRMFRRTASYMVEPTPQSILLARFEKEIIDLQVKMEDILDMNSRLLDGSKNKIRLNPLPTDRIRPPNRDIVETCSICQEEFNKRVDPVCYLDCTHWYHFNCITRWLENKRSCPCCKGAVTLISKTIVQNDEEQMIEA